MINEATIGSGMCSAQMASNVDQQIGNLCHSSLQSIHWSSAVFCLSPSFSPSTYPSSSLLLSPSLFNSFRNRQNNVTNRIIHSIWHDWNFKTYAQVHHRHAFLYFIRIEADTNETRMREKKKPQLILLTVFFFFLIFLLFRSFMASISFSIPIHSAVPAASFEPVDCIFLSVLSSPKRLPSMCRLLVGRLVVRLVCSFYY